MGTSVNQRSPRTPAWLSVELGYGDARFPVEQVAEQVWRAAQANLEANWAQILAAPIVASCMRIAADSQTPDAALRRATIEIVRSRQASIAAEIAKRAIARSFAEPLGKEAAFASAVFGEASNYLVSRDLAGYVGAGSRSKTTTEATAFKEAIREHVEGRVRSIWQEAQRSGRRSWEEFAGAAARRLRGAR